METPSPASEVCTFGPFEVNLRTGDLRKHGIRLRLQEQPLRILVALLERPGETVSREELCRRLWPQGTFVDFEHSLNAAVRRLRVRLGDEADAPRFVETVHRRGYRFLVFQPELNNRRMRQTAWPSRLAVLPFVSFALESRSDLFCEGLTEETITQIARTSPRHVAVIARTSVMRLARREQGAADPGRVLGADYVVEGSVRRNGDHVRIVAQLIESLGETHLWAASFDRVMGDPLTLQSQVAGEIALGVAEALNVPRPPISPPTCHARPVIEAA